MMLACGATRREIGLSGQRLHGHPRRAVVTVVMPRSRSPHAITSRRIEVRRHEVSPTPSIPLMWVRRVGRTTSLIIMRPSLQMGHTAPAASRSPASLRIGDVLGHNGFRYRHDAEQCSAQPELLPAHPVRQKSVVAKPHEPCRQDVQEETADELDRLDTHRLAPALVGIVLPEELDLIAFDRDQPVVADRYSVGVVRQVLQHLKRSASPILGLNQDVHWLRSKSVLTGPNFVI